MSRPLATRLADMAGYKTTLQSFVAKHALNTGDAIDFFQNLHRFPQGEEILSYFATEHRGREFFDTYYDEIQGTLALMHSV